MIPTAFLALPFGLVALFMLSTFLLNRRLAKVTKQLAEMTDEANMSLSMMVATCTLLRGDSGDVGERWLAALEQQGPVERARVALVRERVAKTEAR